MRKLIKAEWYRFTHSSHLLIWTLVLLVVGYLIPTAFNMEFSDSDVYTYLLGAGDNVTVILLFLAALITVTVAMNYQNKTAYYEITSGNTDLKIIGSRVLLYTLVGLVVYFVPFSLVILKSYCAHGMGTGNYFTNAMILFVVVVIHVCLVAILLPMWIRNMVSVVATYLKFMFLDQMFGMTIPYVLSDNKVISPETCSRILRWFIPGQITEIFSGQINTRLVVCVIASLVLECGALFLVTLISMKKKRYR